jgi:hypothetical protein
LTPAALERDPDFKRTIPPGKGRPLGTGWRRSGAQVALIAAIAVLAVTSVDARQSRTPGHNVRAAAGAGQFTWPPPQKLSYAGAGTLTISWDPGSSGITKWRLLQVIAPADANGACYRTTFSDGATIKGTGSSVDVSNHRAGYCYRYRIWAASADPASEPAFVSGKLRVLTPWTGTNDLYRNGVFSTQLTSTWCVAASTQMMLNIIEGQKDHSRDNQQRYIRYARLRDRTPPSAKGTDPQGWVAALNHFGGSTSYQAVNSRWFTWAVRTAVKRLRQTGKPVGLVVAHSTHAWVMTGFEATADPATTTAFKVTSVYVMGSLYPTQQRNGYDMPPDKRVTVDRLRTFLTPYRDRGKNPWQGSFVTIQP